MGGIGNLVELEVTVTTDASGDAVVNTRELRGRVVRVAVEYGDLAAGTTIAITESAAHGAAVLSLAASNTDAVYPNLKQAVSLNTDGSAIASTYDDIYVTSPLVVTIASGGDTKTGTLYIQVEEALPNVL